MTLADTSDLVTVPSLSSAVDGVWRPYQYLGTKSRALTEIGKALLEHSQPGDAVADPFTGSTVVAQLAANLQRRVFASDTSVGAVVAARALLGDPCSGDSGDIEAAVGAVEVTAAKHAELLAALWGPWLPVEDDAVAAGDGQALIELSTSVPQRWREAGRNTENLSELFDRVDAAARVGKSAMGFASTTYAGTYLGLRQAIMIDAYRQAVDDLRGAINPWAANVIICGLLHAASAAAFSAGKHFAQPHKLHAGKDLAFHQGRIVQDRSVSITDAVSGAAARVGSSSLTRHQGHEASLGDVLELTAAEYEKRGIKIAYLDPPYTAQQYSRFYHVLDVIAAGVPVTLQSVRGQVTSGLYPEGKYKSPFCSSRSATPSLKTVLTECRKAEVTAILSYSVSAKASVGNPRMIKLDEVVAFASQLYGQKNVEVLPLTFGYRQFNSSSFSSETRADGEFLVVASVAP